MTTLNPLFLAATLGCGLALASPAGAADGALIKRGERHLGKK